MAVKKTHLGFLGPAIVIVGAAVAGVAIWYMQSARPVAGEEIDTIALDARQSIVVRKEAKSDRSMVELHDGNELKWQALVPHYAGAKGRPAVAWSDRAVTVRVERNGRAEVFAFALHNSQKLGALRLAPEHEPIRMHAQGPITLSDHVRSFELVGGDAWHQIIAIDLSTGTGAWKVDLGETPIADAGIDRGRVWIAQGARRRWFDAATGRETPDGTSLN